MELDGKRSFWSLLEEDKRGSQSPNNRLHGRRHRRLHSIKGLSPEPEPEPELPRVSVSRPSSATVASLSPSSPGACPGSPWAFSPLRCSPSPSPSPSLLYHCLASLQRQDGSVYSIAISGGAVYTGSESDRVRVWKQPDFVDRGYIRTGHGRVRCIAAHGSTLFTTHKDRRVRVWTVSPGTSVDRLRSKKVATLPSKTSAFLLPLHRSRSQQHSDTISCLALHIADGLIYTGSWDRTVKVWWLSEKACLDSFVAHEGKVSAMLVNQLDGCLFTASTDGAVKLWRRVYGDSSHALTMGLLFQPSPVNALALSHARDTCFLYSGTSDGYVNIWEKEAVSGRYNHGGFLQGHRYAVLSLVAIDRVLLSGSEDTTIRVWRREEGSGLHTCLAVMEGHRGPVRCMAASVEVDREGMGLLLYSASLDRVVKVWRIRVVKKDEEEIAAVDGGDCGGRNEEVEYEMSPVLSPLWVEKRLQRTRLF